MTQLSSERFRNRIVGEGLEAPDQLLANPRNWRIHPKNQQDALRATLDNVGWVQRVIVNQQTGHVVDGHLRVALAITEQEPTVPVLYVDLTPEEEGVVLATLDPIGAMAATDKDMLADLLTEVDADPLHDLLTSVAEQTRVQFGGSAADDPGAEVDRAEELRAKWQTERGQLWLIGEHRLLCGDATDVGDIDRLLMVDHAPLCLSDPPYNVGVDYGDAVDDAKSEAEYEAFCRAWFGLWRERSSNQIITPGCNNLARWCRYFDPYHIAPWTKSFSMTNGKVARLWSWEPILFYGLHWRRERLNDIFEFPLHYEEGLGAHPCPKPLPLWADLIDHYTEPGTLVIDAFGGVGTTIVAAEQLGRRCYAMELEPKYVAVTLERLAGMGLGPRLG